MSSLETHNQWPVVKKIYDQLVASGFQALVAGGAVRDLLLGREANDIDLATNATPDQVEELFEKTVMVGKAFGVARVILDGQDVEVATFRKDGEYKDGRKPETVEFCDAKEDALRRDFTVNAMFYDPGSKQVLDYVGGQKDLMQKNLRTVGDPQKRFEEDKLRILRGLRFHGQLQFSLHEDTVEAIKKQASQIHQVSQERKRDELEKLLASPGAASALQKIYDYGLWSHLFGDWRFQSSQYSRFFPKKGEDADFHWTLWFLLHGDPTPQNLLEVGTHWKLKKSSIKKMIETRQMLKAFADTARLDPVDVAIPLSQANGPFALSVFKHLYPGKITDKWQKAMEEVERLFKNGKLPEPLLRGDDLIQYGFSPGPAIAEKLKELYRLQIKNSVTNKEELLLQLKGS